MGLGLCSDSTREPRIFTKQDVIEDMQQELEEIIFEEKRENNKTPNHKELELNNRENILQPYDSQGVKLSQSGSVATWTYTADDDFCSNPEHQDILAKTTPKKVSSKQATRDRGSISINESGQTGEPRRYSRLVGEVIKVDLSGAVASPFPEVAEKSVGCVGARTPAIYLSSTEDDDFEGSQICVDILSRTSSVRKTSEKELRDLGLGAHITTRNLPETPLSLIHQNVSGALQKLIHPEKMSSNSYTDLATEETLEEVPMFSPLLTPRPNGQKHEYTIKSPSTPAEGLSEYFVL